MNWLTGWNWDKIDEIVASFARPYQQYACSSAIAFSAVWSVVVHSSDIVASAAIAAATTVATGTAYMRTIDKKTAATVNIAGNTPKPDTTVTASVQ